MRAYLAIKYHRDNQNRPVIEQLSEALAQSGFECMCVTRDVENWGQVHFAPEALMQRSFAEIDASDVVVIDLTEKGVGLGIEVGYAWARDKPIITVARKGAPISTTLQGISRRVFCYESFAELAEFFGKVVASGVGQRKDSPRRRGDAEERKG